MKVTTEQEPNGSWFQAHCHAIATCLNAELPEPACAYLLSFDTFGLLAALPNVLDALATLQAMCDKYILPRIKSVEGDPLLRSIFGARDAVCFTRPPRFRSGAQRQSPSNWYQFVGKRA